MARIVMAGSTLKVWLSKRDTYNWARRWPCSELSDRRVFAEFDNRNGDLVDMSIDGTNDDVSSNEFDACLSDFIARRHPHHPAIR